MFYVVATPIGNLGDISKRTLEILKVSDLILAEDTRVTQKILNHFDVSTPIKRYNEHNPVKVFDSVSKLLNKGDVVSLVSDSGTPGISDPGSKLVKFIKKELPKVKIRVIPGPSAVVSSLSVSGIPSNEFTFLGFPPAKNKRKKFFKKVKEIIVRPVVMYESPHRLLKTLSELKEEVGEESEIFICKEMTKIYEEHFTGNINQALNYFIKNDDKIKGEFVIILK